MLAAPSRRLLGLCLAGAAASVCLTACGTSDSDKIKNSVKDYIQAVLDDNGSAACALLTSDAAKAFVAKVRTVTKTSDCGTAFTKEASTLSDDEKAVYRSAVLGDETINGDTAKVTIKFTGASEPISLTKVNGDWKIATGPTG
jgi:uncharacterized protein YgiB involved in biofilm formation